MFDLPSLLLAAFCVGSVVLSLFGSVLVVFLICSDCLFPISSFWVLVAGWSLFVPAEACGGGCVVRGGSGVSPPGMVLDLVGWRYILIDCVSRSVMFGSDLNDCVYSFQSVCLFVVSSVG